MSTERIKQLHERATELYLSGDYQGALQAWRDVLGLDPSDEQAMDGLRLASQFVEHNSPVFAEAGDQVERELDQGLKVLDNLFGAPVLHPDTPEGATDRQPRPAPNRESQGEEILDGWELPPAPSAEDEGFGLEAVPESPPSPTASVSAAEAELSRRVGDLLSEAKAKADAGERDEALAILGRLAILDEDNADAAILRSRIEAEAGSDLDRVERAIIEGVAALEADQLDDAERFFRDALALAPEHREAQHYLEKVAERRGGSSEELLQPVGVERAADDGAVQRALAVDRGSPLPTPAPKPPRPAATAPPEPAAPAAATSATRFALPPRRILIWAGGGVLVVACAAMVLPRVLGSRATDNGAGAPSKPVSRTARAARSGPNAKTAAVAPARTLPTDPVEVARSVTSSLARGNALAAAGDFGGAVIAFNEALTLDPKNAEARAGIESAGEQYKASKEQRDAINNISLAFRDGEFTSALRLAYRLPPGVSKSYADAVKFSGWYNLAVVSLRAGDCREALSHIEEALEIAPGESEATKLREFASRYVDAVKDRVFFDYVEALPFRPLPSS